MRVLVIEGDIRAAAALERHLVRQGFNVQCTASGEEAIGLARHDPQDLILLNLRLPDIPGEAVLRRLKLNAAQTPVLVLSADEGIEKRLRCFTLGADDVLVTPYHDDELVARARTIIRRNNGHPRPTLEMGDLSVDTLAHEVRAGGALVPLTRREYQMVELLAMRRGATVTKELFLSQMYDGRDDPGAKIIDVYVCKIRRKLNAVAPDLQARIETVWGRGYALRAEKENAYRIAPILPDDGHVPETRLGRVA